MKTSIYCKAYQLKDFRRFEGWTEAAENAQPVEPEEGATTESAPPRPLTDDSILFLHDDLTVTDGIFLDEQVIFDRLSDEWRRFCMEELSFAVPPELLNDASSPPAD